MALRVVVAVACLALVIFGLGPRTGLYRTLTVLSGSMQPLFGAGDVVVATPEPARDLRVGQVITYRIPVGDHHVETHRVIRILKHGDDPVIWTKGDANPVRDPWTARLSGSTIWRQRWVIPVCRLSRDLASRAGRADDARRPHPVPAGDRLALRDLEGRGR